MAIPLIVCMLAVASALNIPPRVLPAIQMVEGGAVGTVSQNRDGSQGLGLMQINTRWLPAQRTRRDETTVPQALLQNPCFNIAVAGALLRVYLAETRGDLLAAIGDYHSHTVVPNYQYQSQVIAAAVAVWPRHARQTVSDRQLLNME